MGAVNSGTGEIVGMLFGEAEPPHLPFASSQSPSTNNPFKTHRKLRDTALRTIVVLPGSEIPKWFQSDTTGVGQIVIELPGNWHNFLLLGVVPFPKDVTRLKHLDVGGVITLNEPYEGPTTFTIFLNGVGLERNT